MDDPLVEHGGTLAVNFLFRMVRVAVGLDDDGQCTRQPPNVVAAMAIWWKASGPSEQR
jgi:hypothetical protein